MFLRDWRFWIGAAVSVLFLGILVYQVDFGEIKQSLRQANYLYVIPAVTVYFIAVYFRAVRWRYLLSPIASFRVRRLYPVVVIGYMANNLLPARLGELVRSYYLSQRENCPASTALATVMVERVYDGLTLLLFAVVAAPVLLMLGRFQGYGNLSGGAASVLAAGVVAIFVAALLVLTLLAKTSADGALAGWFLRLAPTAGARDKVRDLVHAFIEGLGILNSPGKHLVLLLFSIPIWLLESSMYLLVGYSFGLDGLFPSIWVFVLAALLLTATSNLVTSLPTAMGGIGPFELVAQQTLVALGAGASVAGAYAGFLHIVALWLPVNLVGLALLFAQNISLKQLTSAPKVSGSEAVLSTSTELSGPSEGL
ncbi:MAG: hypothetical protein BZY80_01845 [SAR202 cluster bacterium Io17-Chloro-G2]|nr:MAG: hypothetical protein BZY80_01845 [SAR202 cluster bacterium Io17-Chloro-G2]